MKTPLEEAFENLIVIESFIDEMKQKKRVMITNTERLLPAFEKSARVIRGHIKIGYKSALNNMEFTRPKASRHAISKRKWRAKKREVLFEKIERYFDGEL